MNGKGASPLKGSSWGRMRNIAALVLFAATLTLSAALLFLMEPMIAKMLLPLLGGMPSVWNTCMVFFQVTLLLGYLYAHLLSTRLSLNRQLMVHAAVLLLPLIVLPTTVSGRGAPSPETSPVFWLLATLALVAGLPFFAVTTCAPLLQKWFSKLSVSSAGDPYFLYAASNFGSLAGLVLYPFFVEPRWTLGHQSHYWQVGYIILIALSFLCGFMRFREKSQVVAYDAATGDTPKSGDDAGHGQITNRRRMSWIVLTALPCSLFLGLTTFVTTSMASMPLLWAIPLAIYLITIILAFSRLPEIFYRITGAIAPWLVLGTFILITTCGIHRGIHSVLVGLPLQLVTLFVVCMVLHGRVAKDRPSTRYLTEYYLLFSFGGALGSMFNAFAAPLIFNMPIEYPLMLGTTGILLYTRAFAGEAGEMPRTGKSASSTTGESASEDKKQGLLQRMPLWVLPTVIVIISYILFTDPSRDYYLTKSGRGSTLIVLFDQAWRLAIPLFLAVFLLRTKRQLLTSLFFLLIISAWIGTVQKEIVYSSRNFFGVSAVRVNRIDNSIELFHDVTMHGKQLMDPQLRNEPISYYTPDSSIGRIIVKLFGAVSEDEPIAPARAPNTPAVPDDKTPVYPNFAVVGLGTGTLAAYAHSGQVVDLYEINPTVVKLATDPFYFTYLYSAYRRGVRLNFKVGDARIMMKEAPQNGYGLIVLDAFSSDTIPFHLMTREALELYRQKLVPGGVIAYHCSSKYYDIVPAVWNLLTDAKMHGLVCYGDFSKPSDQTRAGSLWVFASDDKEKIAALKLHRLWLSEPVETRKDQAVWTDDFSNPLAFIKTRETTAGLLYINPDGSSKLIMK